MDPILAFFIGLLVGTIATYLGIMLFAKFMNRFKPLESQVYKNRAIEKWEKKNKKETIE